MKEYKRLTDKKIDLDKLSEKAKSKISDTYLKYAKMNNALWELENKIENGTLIELPCKVGDTVYSNERIMFEPVVVKVITTHQSMNLPVSYTMFATAKDGYGIYLSSDNFNEDWFLTKAEAEKKLKELKE